MASTLLGQQEAYSCKDGVEIKLCGVSPSRPAWVIRPGVTEATLEDRNIHTEETSLFVVPDLAAYERFLKQKLTRLEGVASIESSFALEQVKYTNVLPVV